MKPGVKKYLIEFAVIFMSITLSFVVEEWRTSQQEKKVRKEFFQRLKAELKQKMLETQQFIDNNKSLIIDNERVAVNFKTREISEDSLLTYLLRAEHLGNIDPELATWESLKSSGVFASINPQIIDSVNSLLRAYKGIQDGNKYLADLYLQTWPQFLPDIPPHVLTTEYIAGLQSLGLPLRLPQIKISGKTDMSKFLNNSIAIDYFFTRTFYARGMDYGCKSLPGKEKRLIELIEKELEE